MTRPPASVTGTTGASGARQLRARLVVAGVALAALLAGYAPWLAGWVRLALADDLQSHVLLIPLVCGFLLWSERDCLDWRLAGAPWLALMVALMAGGLLAAAHAGGHEPLAASALAVASLVVACWALGFALLGWRWMFSARFACGFLLFMVPVPDELVAMLDRLLVAGSAWLAECLFRLGGVPVFRVREVLELPGIVLRVADACSGIRSTWVLLITSVLAGHLFLPAGRRRALLVAVVLPLGILRNAARIFVIGWLCANYGPDMIHSWIHRRGGPVFFAASLVPLAALAWWLRTRPAAHATRAAAESAMAPPAALARDEGA